ncbi:MAG: polysaccharide deacetylase family protein [Flavobacterium sp.]|nr:polysaccharide deacetylase family protein [Flavobacterium sp.]
MWYWIKTNRLIKRIFSNYVWDIPTVEKKVYLTFDDGPTPKITPWVLNQLKEFNAKATFFCIGDNIQKHPEIFQSVLQNGHIIGNHTFNHLNGWKTKTLDYIENVQCCKESIQQLTTDNQQLFRPPYGKIRKSQANMLRKEGYKIIMWDVLSGDFDTSISPEKCIQNVVRHTQPGSIIVFHDSVKSYKNLEFTLPKYLTFLKQNNYVCEVIV